MKHLKKILAAAFLGFLAFAPPGTLIFLGVLALAILGKTWFIIGSVVGLTALGVYAYFNRAKLSKIRLPKSLFPRKK